MDRVAAIAGTRIGKRHGGISRCPSRRLAPPRRPELISVCPIVIFMNVTILYIPQWMDQMETATRKTTVEIDEELFQRVRGALGTTTLRETVDGAFRAVLRERARREEVEALSTMRGMDLDDAGVMEGAWRP